MHIALGLLFQTICVLYLKSTLQVTGGLQLQLSQICSTLYFDVPSTDRVCGPGTLGIYFERTVDMSFNVIYLVDDLLSMTWHTNNFTKAAGKYQVKILTNTPSSGYSTFHVCGGNL